MRLDHDTMAARVGVMEKLFEKFFYDFSMYKTHFAHKMDYQRYVQLCVAAAPQQHPPTATAAE